MSGKQPLMLTHVPDICAEPAFRPFRKAAAYVEQAVKTSRGIPSQESRIPVSVHPRAEITHSRKGYFDILTKTGYYPEFKNRLLLVSEKSIKFAIFKKIHSTHEKTKQHYFWPAHGLSYGLHPK